MDLDLDVSVCQHCDYVHLAICKDGKEIFSAALSEESWSALWASHALARREILKRNGQREATN